MSKHSKIFFTLFTLILTFALADAEEIRLGEGRSLKGDIVKTTTDAVFVDLGYTILSVPKKEILEIIEKEAGTEPDAKNVVTSQGLFRQVDAKEMSVLDNVKRIGEGVILVRTPGGLGSGSIIHPEGYAITNAHVIQGEQDITITVFTQQGDSFEKKVFKKVRILASNPFMDLALLKIDEEEKGDFEFTIVPFGDSDRVKTGESVFAIGNPMGYDRTVSEGIVSITNRASQGLTYVQTTAAVNPGNSGGPLFNLKGEMIGVTSFIRINSEGLNFAIPVYRVKEFLVNRDAFAYDKDNPNSGYHYLKPPTKGMTMGADE